ncbi:hypothetical protein D917_06758 [Trichinella nativa]|uniref:Uncharacterized protein n=1 Tax=Trichinella nativa TaxID=6335 RepID=A0A1Y3EV12_9BILA|nr:hypothetical protein D917_06758 [Trichinella nativa]
MVIYANKVFQPRAVCNQIASLRSNTNKKRVLLRVPLTRNVPAINEVTVLSSFGSSYHINAKECYLYFKKAFATNTC